jgi:Dynamin family
MQTESNKVSADSLDARVLEYAGWRKHLGESLGRFTNWLDENELSDPSLSARAAEIQARLRNSRMSVAFVAEFSRGKSELINALFFAGYGKRILPSSAGRTTMCPTELMYDPTQTNCIRLLPIESRLREVSMSELRSSLSEWHEIAIHVDDVDSVSAAFEAVRETKKVSIEEATLLGFYDPQDQNSAVLPDRQAQIEVPRWRHAIVNIPDPLLERGLVIIDTPGLNAIGNEPELTLNIIPNADAVLFVLAADAGVTRTDIDIWREHISKSHQSGRLVVLNKIDGLWDELRSEAEIDHEIDSQVASVAETLSIPSSRIYPVSAQKGLVAKVQNDPALLMRSRIKQLEFALSQDLVYRQQQVTREHVERSFNDIHGVAHSVLQSRRRSVVEQLFELNSLRGKNSSVVSMMAARIRQERSDFDKSLKHFQAMRTVMTRHAEQMYSMVSLDQLKRHVRKAREEMGSSNFSLGLRDGMDSLITNVQGDFNRVSSEIDQVSSLMSAMYKTFSAEHGLSLGVPLVFSTRRYSDEVERLAEKSRVHFGALTLITTEKFVVMRRFFESIASRIRHIYDSASRDIETWLRAVASPIEGQVREYQAQLRRRLESVRRVLDASDSLEGRITELDEQRTEVEQQLALFEDLSNQVSALLSEPMHMLLHGAASTASTSTVTMPNAATTLAQHPAVTPTRAPSRDFAAELGVVLEP